MKKYRIYIDTSVIGGCFDTEFKVDSNILFEELRKDLFIGVVSEITIEELQYAPQKVRKKFDEYKLKFELLNLTEEVTQLTEKYINEEIFSSKYKNDCIHIAFATVYKVDVLVSWNFKHIVNFEKINKFNAVNLKNGYQTIQIYSPKEVINSND